MSVSNNLSGMDYKVGLILPCGLWTGSEAAVKRAFGLWRSQVVCSDQEVCILGDKVKMFGYDIFVVSLSIIRCLLSQHYVYSSCICWLL